MLIFGGILLTCGDVFLKYWSLKDKWWMFAGAMLIYLFGVALLGITFKSRNLAVASTIMVMVNSLTLVLVSVFYFNKNKDMFHSLFAKVHLDILVHHRHGKFSLRC